MNKIKTKLKGRKIKCQNFMCADVGTCTKWVDHHHHLFSNTKHNRNIYGDLLNSDFNIMFINSDCHLNKVIPKLTELQFREIAEAAGYTDLPTSKTLAVKKFNFFDKDKYKDKLKNLQ